MRLACAGALFLLIVLNGMAKEKPKVAFNEPYRPQFHFSVPENQLGSPIAFYKIDSLYHLLFQHNPHNLLEGYIHWGHAVSPNMLNWVYKGIVLAQPDSATMPTSAMPWWGSVAGNPPGKIFFNRYDLGLFQGTFNHREAIADELSVSSKELFRRCEPFVFRYEPTSRWIMASYDRQQSKLIFFQSVDGHEWHETGSLEHPFGFPALYEMKVDRKPDDKRWVLFGEQGTYLIGQFDGSGFRPEGEVKRFDINNNLGASVCLVEEGNNGRLVMISELKSPAHADLPTNGQFTFPAELELVTSDDRLVLRRKPVEELTALFGKKMEVKNQKVYPGLKNNVLSKLKGDAFCIKMVVDLRNSDFFGLMIRANKKSNGTELGYNVQRQLISLAGHNKKYIPKNNRIELELLIDRSSIEVFIDGGEEVISASFTPEPNANRYELFTRGGEIIIESLEVYPLKSIWR